MGRAKYDVVIDGTSARLDRGTEGNFKERSIRTEITQNLLSQTEGSGMSSRPDRANLYQSNWAGGTRWWKPIIAGDELNTYNISTNLDTWSQPGKVVPRNQPQTINTHAGLNNEAPVVAYLAGALYSIADDDLDNASHWDVGKWVPASEAFIIQSTYNSGVNDSSFPIAAVGDPSDGYIYVIAEDGELVRFNPGTAAENGGWITGLTFYPGANIFLHNQNLMFYSGDQLYTVDKVVPSATVAFNDGMGKDFLADAHFNEGTTDGFWEHYCYLTLAVATPEGIYYVKNTRQGGQPQAWIFRVDRDEAGNWIGNPLGVLPMGSVALGIAWHLGSIIISASPDWNGVLRGEEPDIEIVLYHMTAGSLGALGSVLGNFNISSTPYKLLGSEGALLYFGKLWVYDAIRGGLHSISDNSGAFNFMATVTDLDGDSANLFYGFNGGSLYKVESEADPDIVTAFGDDENFYTLESNYFDMGLPMETKEITRVAIMKDLASTASAQEWTLQISTDDATFADVLTHSATSAHAEATISAGTHRGRLFRYKLIYQTKNSIKRALRAVLVTANAGEMVREFEFILDGTSLANIEGVQLRPAVFAAAMRTTAAKEQAISVTVNYQDIDKSADQSETVTCKVQLCEIIKDKADEAKVHLIVREV